MIRFLILLLIALPVWADNVDKTWAGAEWDTGWSDVSDAGGCDTTTNFVYSATGGNPTNCRKATCLGRNDTATRHSLWTGTWEDMGVTAGWSVSTVQMLDLDTQLTTDTGCDTSTMGPLQLRDSGGTLISTLWAGRTATAAEGSFTAAGAQSAQSVGSLTASNSAVRLWLNSYQDIANSTAQTCVNTYDNLDLRIVASSYTRKRVYIIGTRFDEKGWKVKEVHDL